MPELTYINVYIDLTVDLEERFKKIDCRTEIRMARKSGVITRVLSGKKDPAIVAMCARLLRTLLKKKLVPFPPLFQTMLEDEKNWLLLAEKDGVIASFALLNPENKASGPLAGKKTARLEVMATDSTYKKLCPNYLVIWSSIEFLKAEGYEAMIWGFSHYLNCPDPEFDSVRFYKEKWFVSSYPVTEKTSWPRYIFFRHFRRFSFVKKIIYWIKIYLLKEELPVCV